MKLEQALLRCDTILAEGSVYELLRRDPRVAFDPDIAHAGLVYDELLRPFLAGVHREYLRIAGEAGLPAIAFADTWRASAARIARSPFAGRDVNGDNVRFIRGLAKEAGGEVIVAAYTGPRGDGYRPDEAPGREEAMRIHDAQIEALAMSEVDLIVAATLPSLEEARGIASLLAHSGVAWMLSFVVRRDGTLLDGTPLGEAISRIDDDAPHPPVGYAVNCVHPDVFCDAARAAGGVNSRIIALQANASALSPEELDGSETVEGDEPVGWAAAMLEVRRVTRLPIVGGCCGTSPDHIRALVTAIVGG